MCTPRSHYDMHTVVPQCCQEDLQRGWAGDNIGSKPREDPPRSEACPPERPPEGAVEAPPGILPSVLEPQHQRGPQNPAVTARPRSGKELCVTTHTSSLLGLPLSLPGSPYLWIRSPIPEAPPHQLNPALTGHHLWPRPEPREYKGGLLRCDPLMRRKAMGGAHCVPSHSQGLALSRHVS